MDSCCMKYKTNKLLVRNLNSFMKLKVLKRVKLSNYYQLKGHTPFTFKLRLTEYSNINTEEIG